MIITSISTKTIPEVTSITMEVDYVTTKNIYDLKIVISKHLGIEIDSIFLYTASESSARIYQNKEYIENIDEIFYKKLKNSCNVCGTKATIITGDCAYCKCKYCNAHRLPETHKCACIHAVKHESFNDNYTRVMNGKCVAAQI